MFRLNFREEFHSYFSLERKMLVDQIKIKNGLIQSPQNFGDTNSRKVKEITIWHVYQWLEITGTLNMVQTSLFLEVHNVNLQQKSMSLAHRSSVSRFLLRARHTNSLGPSGPGIFYLNYYCNICKLHYK